MDDTPTIIGAKMINKGYIYTRSKYGANNTTYWDCQKLRTKQCRSRAVSTVVNGGVIITKETEHDHAPDREVAEAEKIKFDLKQEALTNKEQGPSTILRNVLASTSAGVVAHLPERSNLKKSIRVVRRKNLPPNPKSLEELREVPEEYSNTITGDAFLLYDSAQDGKLRGRVLVFATRRNIELLAESDTWFLDGTFKVISTLHNYFEVLSAIFYLGFTADFYATFYDIGFSKGRKTGSLYRIAFCLCITNIETGRRVFCSTESRIRLC